MTAANEWLEGNQRYLTAAIAAVREALERHLGAAPSATDAPDAKQRLEAAANELRHAPALEVLAVRFGLSPFERDVLLLCAGCELDASFAALLGRARGGEAQPSFGIALAALPDAHWSALAPTAALRTWRLVELGTGDSLTAAPLRIDERILHYLTGLSYVDERCQPLVAAVPATPIGESHTLASRKIAESVAGTEAGPLPRIELWGNDGGAKRGVARHVCDLLGTPLYSADAGDLPSTLAERDTFARLWQREAILTGAALMIDVEEATPEQRRGALAVAERIDSLVFLRSREPLSGYRGSVLRVEIAKPRAGEQRDLWRRVLGERAATLNGEIDVLASHFDLGAAAITTAARQVLTWTSEESGREQLAADLWDACRAEARPKLDDLARRLTSTPAWDDLILPQRQIELLGEIVQQVRHRATVYERWGFGGTGMRGLGISALFAGPSGTGKTLAAEVLARELRLDLYVIDLSSVVSKYIGQTEENLRKVFDAAEEGGAVLLFDEADALFGRRTEVKDSHDRYANIEVSYLLQRMEAYRGLAILTTNLRSALDTAFLRRLRFIVDFPFPDAQQRAGIWRRTLPELLPRDGVEPEKLARLNVAGGNIRNIAVNAAFLAAAAGEPLRMTHLLRAARSECGKIERPITEAETAGWL
jgi:hypothetical protein